MKQIHFDDKAMSLIKAGVDKLADVVQTTLGPGGSNVILQRNGRHHVTKDGVTIAREIELPDSIENLGANIIKEAASRTADSAGDGTTSSIVLARAILNAGIKAVTAGANRIDVKRGIDAAVKVVVDILKKMAQPVAEGDIEKIANISSNGDPEITRLITEAIHRTGKDGIVIVEDAKGSDSELVMSDGSKFQRGWLSSYFVTHAAQMECVLEQPYILLYDGVITSFSNELFKPFQDLMVAKQGNVPILVIAHDIQGVALATMTANKMDKGFAICAVQAPEFGEIRTEVLQDIAALTGARVISKSEGLSLQNMTVDMYGTCKRVRISQWATTIIEGSGAGLLARINQIQKQMEEANPNALEKLKDRLARLTSKMGVLYVGGATDVEVMEKKDRIDDALCATRAALDEGVVVGGGVAYIRALQYWNDGARPKDWQLNEDGEMGAEIIRKSLVIPIQVIAENVGMSGQVVLNRVMTQNASLELDDILTWYHGFNAKTLQYENLMASGVVDPLKVARLALENAASVAGMILTTKSVVSQEDPQQIR